MVPGFDLTILSQLRETTSATNFVNVSKAQGSYPDSSGGRTVVPGVYLTILSQLRETTSVEGSSGPNPKVTSGPEQAHSSMEVDPSSDPPPPPLRALRTNLEKPPGMIRTC